MKTLNDIKESEGRPKLNHFTDWANATSQYWLATTMSPTPFHPLNMGLSTGTAGVPVPITHIINNGGNIPLKAGLLTAFYSSTITSTIWHPICYKISSSIYHSFTIGWWITN